MTEKTSLNFGLKIKKTTAPVSSVGAIKIKVVMTKTEEKVIELYQKKTPITKIVAATGVSIANVYGILSEHDIPLHSGQKTFRHSVMFDLETEKLLQKANPANISAWVCQQIKENNR